MPDAEVETCLNVSALWHYKYARRLPSTRQNFYLLTSDSGMICQSYKKTVSMWDGDARL